MDTWRPARLLGERAPRVVGQGAESRRSSKVDHRRRSTSGQGDVIDKKR
jgi:hypothetical protein